MLYIASVCNQYLALQLFTFKSISAAKVGFVSPLTALINEFLIKKRIGIL